MQINYKAMAALAPFPHHPASARPNIPRRATPMALLDSVIAGLLWFWLVETLFVAVVGLVAFGQKVHGSGGA
jgi:hypothetical protein